MSWKVNYQNILAGEANCILELPTLKLQMLDGKAVLYGGLHYNEFIQRVDVADLDAAIDWCINNSLVFDLRPIKLNGKLSEKLKRYSQNYNEEWSQEKPVQNIPTRYISKAKSTCKINNLELRVESNIDSLEKEIIHNRHIEFFEKRGIESGWKGKLDLWLSLLCNFEKEKVITYLLYYNSQGLVLAGILVKHDKEMIYWFGSVLKPLKAYPFHVLFQEIILRFDVSDFCCLNAMRGDFGYKSKYNFNKNRVYAFSNRLDW